jgi:hypothetical protein
MKKPPSIEKRVIENFFRVLCDARMQVAELEARVAVADDDLLDLESHRVVLTKSLVYDDPEHGEFDQAGPCTPLLFSGHIWYHFTHPTSASYVTPRRRFRSRFQVIAETTAHIPCYILTLYFHRSETLRQGWTGG